MRSVLGWFASCLACATLASAQVTTIPVSLGDPIDTAQSLSELESLTQLYGRGDWREVQKKATALLLAAKTRATGDAQAALDPTKHYLIVTWLASDPFGKPMLARVIVHHKLTGDPFSNDLPGIGAADDDEDGADRDKNKNADDEPRVYQVFLSRGNRGRIASVYGSTRDKDPFLEELPAFVQAIASPLFAAIGTFAGPAGMPPARSPTAKVAAAVKPTTVFASVASVSLPFKRATVKWKALAKEPVEASVFSDDIDGFAASLRFAQPAHAVCTRWKIDALTAGIADAANEGACAGPEAKSTACRARIDSAIAAVVTEPQEKQPEACTPMSGADASALTAVEQSFRDFVTGAMTNSAEADITFKNRPLTHWTFGAGAGVLSLGHLSKPRVKVDDNLLVADPLGRVVTTTFVNWSPAGYDSERSKVSGAERARLFFGATMTPDFGLTGGVNVLLTRGIGVTVGGVLMFAQGAEAADIGEAPGNPDKPYEISYARGLLIGISYNFK